MEDSYPKQKGIWQIIWFLLLSDHNFFYIIIYIRKACNKNNIGIIFHIKIIIKRKNIEAIRY